MNRYLAWASAGRRCEPLPVRLLERQKSAGSRRRPANATTDDVDAAAAVLIRGRSRPRRSYKAYAHRPDRRTGARGQGVHRRRPREDLQAAQDAYAPSREPWERIEPIAGLVEQIDRKIDARVDDFAGVDDPEFTGWHRLEYLLFEKNTTEGGAPFADQLDKDVADLKAQFPSVEVKPIDVSNGAAELIEEVSEGKITGEEDRYSKTDLWDFDANLQGSQDAVGKLKPALGKPIRRCSARSTPESIRVFETLQPLRQR